jgi:hypothetical protein
VVANSVRRLLGLRVQHPSIQTIQTEPNGPKHRVTANGSLHGRLFEEGKILSLANAIERRLKVWDQRPPIG